ncbi:MAG: hypothetical protein WBR26_19170 [Candidatus Acidiferrum sp.]
MLPADLQPEQFGGYPPEARKLALDYLGTFRQLPIGFLPNLLREVIEYDFRFPAERRSLERELANLRSLSAEDIRDWFRSFAAIQVSSKLERLDWVNSPAQFVEQLSAHLWTTHQMDAFRNAALAYADRLRAAVPPEPPPLPRLGIAVIGQGVQAPTEPLFRKLRPHGVYFSAVNPENGLSDLLQAVASRAKANPSPYAHWYVEGGPALPHDSAVTCVSYDALAPVRTALLAKIQAETQTRGMGPEALRTLMAQLRPEELGLSSSSDPVLARFQIKVLTEGSGTQIFSTSFAQWTAREVLRRAQPLTLLVRFAPRQRQKPMNELLSPNQQTAELDRLGSLLDADMGAYYNWINQQRLPGSDKSLFLAWFENHNEAVAVSPSLPRGTVSASTGTLSQLLSWMA